MKPKRALISVWNKKGIVEFTKSLERAGIEIISTGGTSKLLKKNGIKVKEVSEVTGHPEILDDRVKTLHPKIHGGILALRTKEHLEQLKENNIGLIDIVVCNLYPFKETISKSNFTLKEALENIDIGGPTLIRAASKNFENVAVIVDPNDYRKIVDELETKGELSKDTLRILGMKGFNHTAEYDSLISNYFNKEFEPGKFPPILTLSFQKLQDLRYGENPHQSAAFYQDPFIFETGVANIKQIHGKQLSFNNVLDANDALELVKEFNEPTAAVIKHTNPSGIATKKTIEEAYKEAHFVDPMSAFGSVIALNRNCNKATAEIMKDLFIEVVICPKFEKEAFEVLSQKKNIRLLETCKITKSDKGYDMKKVIGGLLMQTRNFPAPKREIFTKKVEYFKGCIGVVTKRIPTQNEIRDLIFSWRVNKHTKSNSVVFVKNETAVACGVGQMSRVDSTMIAAAKSAKRAKGSVMSSDAFFPFKDGVEEAAKAGITAIIQPGGSVRDQEVIDTANKHNIAMVFSGIRLFKH